MLSFRETLATGDIDGDGRLDLAAVSRRRWDDPEVLLPEARVVVFRGNGAGFFSRVAAVPVWQEVTPGTIEAADGLDLAVLPLEPDNLDDLAVLVRQMSVTPTHQLRLFTLKSLGLPSRRESLPVASAVGTPVILHAGADLLGGPGKDLVIGGTPPPGGNSSVEVRHAP